jgi:hypothetical protein
MMHLRWTFRQGQEVNPYPAEMSYFEGDLMAAIEQTTEVDDTVEG